MATFNGIEVPADGQKITVDGMRLNVPDRPIIPFIEGDGTGHARGRAQISDHLVSMGTQSRDLLRTRDEALHLIL